MSKKELISGTVLILVLTWLLISVTSTALEAFNRASIPLIPNSSLSKAVAWIVTIVLVGQLVFWIWLAKQANPHFDRLSEKFTVRSVIPGYFFLAITPVFIGLALAVLTKLINWGSWLECLSIPTLLAMAWILFRTKTQ